MNGRGLTVRLSTVAIISFLLVASVGNTNINIENVKGAEDNSRGIWEDNFNDQSKIDPSPPGSGMSDNYEVSGGKVGMINTYPAWTDSDWNKMRIITVTNNAGQNLNGYALEMTISYDSDMQSDYDDLRFKHEDDPDSYLGYWIESYDSTNADVWINIPTLQIGTSEVYMFYGNPGASSESSFGSVFSDWDEYWSSDEKITNHADNEGTWDPDVCFDGTDEFIVAWEEGQAYYPPWTWGFQQEIRASIYDSSGTKLVNDKLIFKDSTTYFRNEDPSIAYGAGKWFVAWEHFDTIANPTASTMDIKARTVQRSGTSLTLGTVRNVCTESNCQADPNVEFDSVNNKFCVVWEDARNGMTNYDLYGRLYNSDGTEYSSEIVISDATNSQCEPWIAFDSVNGRFMIVWEEGVSPSNGPFDIWAGLYNADLSEYSSPQKIADGSSDIDYNFPCVFFNPEAEEFLITWNSGDISDDDWWGDVYGTILDSEGDTVVDTFTISSGNYVRTDIATYPVSGFEDPYFVTYDDNDRIYGKIVTADGEASTDEIQLCVGTDPDIQADWANMDIGDGKVFVAWEDKRVNYPSQYDFYPDVFGNIWELQTQTGLSVSYSVGSEKDKILLAHVTSIEIQKPSTDFWDEFNAIDEGAGLTYSILDGATGSILIADIDSGDSLSGVTASSLRIMATFTRASPASTPKVDYWSVSWIENSPPNTPSNPDPSDGETDVDINADLSWTCSDPDGDSLTYDVYFGTSNPPPLVSTGQSQNTYDPGVMNFGTTYYWKIVAFDIHGASTSGPVWSFTTWSNNPPNEPSNPDPANGETDVDIDADLFWTCSDPDGDSLSYDVYFSSVNPPNQVSWNQSATTYNPGTLDMGTTYYWKIVAWDIYDASTSGPVWSFTTIGNDPPNTPSNPDPSDGETGVDINADLSWTCSDPNGDDLSYKIYFGTVTPPPLKAQDYEDTTWDPGTMQLETTYYWKIIAEDVHGAETEGPIWDFTTGTNDPPYTPNSPNPTDGAIDVPVDVSLCWEGGDPDGDSCTYDLYFDTVTPPGIFKHDLTGTCYGITGMSHLTTYYWKIVSRDVHGAETEGPVWSFTTVMGEENNPPATPTITGKLLVYPNKLYDYTVQSNDPEGEDIYYRIYWGDNMTGWMGPFESGEPIIFSHSWTETMTAYMIIVYAKDINGNHCKKNGQLLIFCPRDVKSNILYKLLNRITENHPIFALLLKVISQILFQGKFLNN